MFKEGDIVFIRRDSAYEFQIASTGGKPGRIYKARTNNKGERWYDVRFPNGYDNAYRDPHLRHAYSNNKNAAKSLLEEEY